MNPEVLLFGVLALAGIIGLLRIPPSRVAGRIFAILVLGLAGFGAIAWTRANMRRSESHTELLRGIPHPGRPDGYVSSDKCQACHPNQYATWHHSFHRTMTQIASPETVLGNFANVRLELQGQGYQLEKHGSELWIEVDDREWKPSPLNPRPDTANVPPSFAPRVRQRIGLVTGSHHMQVYWTRSDAGNRQAVFPFAWLIEEQRWVLFNDTFLRDPATPSVPQSWNLNCINCHSTGGQPRPNRQQNILESRVGELGIACEACHGTADEHVRANQSPIRRYWQHQAKSDATVVNPARLSPHDSSQVCGQCHGIKWIPNRDDWLENGFHYQPGQQLAKTTPIIQPTKLRDQPWLKAPLQQNPRFLADRYWPDGMVRVSGREYNGLIESPCHQRGDLSCLSCHSMHRGLRDDQLDPAKEGNQACLQCHKIIDIEKHTHHRRDSSGSECYNCHMPHTTYGLLKAIRSHQIDSPSVKTSLKTGRPNACNLCHLDKTLDWTAQHLSMWYGHEAIAVSAEDKSISAALLWTLKGDAGQRALLAWHMGWEPARSISGKHWPAAFLAELLDDPYSAVRFIASRSLKRFGAEYQKLVYDFVGPPEERTRARKEALEIWKRLNPRTPNRADRHLLIEANGALREDVIGRLRQQRNDRSMDLQE